MIALIHFWSGMIAWLIILYYAFDLAVNDRWPLDNTYFSKTILVREKEKEWDE